MILVLNCGSQTIKYKLFGKKLKLKKEGKTESFRFLKDVEENIDLVGHRVVHGGSEFVKPTVITKKVLKKLKKYNKLAPLHNPYNLLGIKKSQRAFPKARHIAVFDTEFYKTLKEKVYTYPIPGNFRKYGFHGISHEYASKKEKGKVISIHLGGGSSITAIKGGKPVDTSMGYTPLEGLMMMTRSGDIDPGIVVGKNILNKESGIKAICGETDMRKVLKRKDKKAKLALNMYVYRIQKYIGAYYAILGGCDILVFTGAIGAGSAKIRKMIIKNLSILNKTKTKVVKPDEELSIAKKILCLKN